MKYGIKIIRIGFDGTTAEKISLVGVSEAIALKVLDIYGQSGYDIRIFGYTELKEGEKDV